MRARHLYLPGLHSGLLDRLGVLEARPPRERARLVTSFGRSSAIVEASLRTGTPPSTHRVLFAGESTRVPDLLGEAHTRSDAGTIDAIDRELATELDALPSDGILLVSGGPVHAAAPGCIELRVEGAPGWSTRVDRDFALVEHATAHADLPAALRDRWLATRGVARVLAPSAESAGGWMAPADRGWLVLPEPGYRFSGSAEGNGDEPVLLAFGAPWTAPWPDAVHDWRIAPTLCHANGRDFDSACDTPLAGVPAARS